MTTFRLPDLGEGLTESTILTWHVAEGDEVHLNQLLAEVETAKAVVELSSPYEGRIATLHAAEGETLPVGAPLVEVETESAATESAKTPSSAPEDTSAGDAAPGDTAPEDTAPGDSAPGDGDSRATAPAPERQAVLVGYGPVLSGGERPRRRPRSFTTVPFHGRSEEGAAQNTPTALQPVRKHARDLGVDLSAVHGTGPRGRILRADVDACATGAGAPSATPARISTFVPVTGLRRQTARAMVDSATNAPQAAVLATVDVTKTLKQVRRATQDGRPTSFLAVVCRAVMLAAARTPSANARFVPGAEQTEQTEQTAQIEQFSQVELGVAVATERGLMVATIPEAASVGVPELTERIAAQAARAREGALNPAELTGSTLTVTNVGVFGVEAGIPLLNPGQSTVVAIGAIQRRPWEHRGKVALRKVVTLSVAFDHRVLDGAEASAFLTDITDVLSAPQILLTR